MGALVYSFEGEYFLIFSEDGKVLRAHLGIGRYRGTLTFKSFIYERVYYFEQYTPHPEYCVAWLPRKDNISYYDMLFYDRSIVSDRFMENALTTEDDIDKVLMKQDTWVDGIGYTLVEEETLQFYRSRGCTSYWNLLGE